MQSKNLEISLQNELDFGVDISWFDRNDLECKHSEGIRKNV